MTEADSIQATNIRLPRVLLEAVDTIALQQRRSRNRMIEVVLAAYVARHAKNGSPGGKPEAASPIEKGSTDDRTIAHRGSARKRTERLG